MAATVPFRRDSYPASSHTNPGIPYAGRPDLAARIIPVRGIESLGPPERLSNAIHLRDVLGVTVIKRKESMEWSRASLADLRDKETILVR
jgi:hypothetical protein